MSASGYVSYSIRGTRVGGVRAQGTGTERAPQMLSQLRVAFAELRHGRGDGTADVHTGTFHAFRYAALRPGVYFWYTHADVNLGVAPGSTDIRQSSEEWGG